MNSQETLALLGACTTAREWVGRKSLQRAWETCHDIDWMLWFARKLSVWTPEIDAEYQKVCGAADAEYEKVRGAAIRALLPWPVLAAALKSVK